MCRILHAMVFFWISKVQSESLGSQMVFRNGRWVFQGQFDVLIFQKASTVLFPNSAVSLSLGSNFPIHKQTISEISHKWNDVVTVGNNKTLAQALKMSSTYRLRFDAFIHQNDYTEFRTLFHGTDGGSFTQHRCGGRLPGIWVRHHGALIRHALNIYRPVYRPVNFILAYIDCIFVAVSMEIQIVAFIQPHLSLTDG